MRLDLGEEYGMAGSIPHSACIFFYMLQYLILAIPMNVYICVDIIIYSCQSDEPTIWRYNKPLYALWIVVPDRAPI